MERDPTSQVAERLKGAEVAGLLREADTLIRLGRYLAAGITLDKIQKLDPENEVAYLYRDRIQFISKQIPHRVMLSKDAQAEVQKTRAVLLQKRIDEANEQIAKGKGALDAGDFKTALKNFEKALLVDPENIYARALAERLEEMEEEGTAGSATVSGETKLVGALRNAWRDGVPSGVQEETLSKLQTELGISDGARLAIQRRIKNALYKETLRNIWLTGGIAAFTPNVLEELRKKFAVSLIDHSSLEAEMIQEVRKNKLKGTILVVDEREDELLEITSRLRTHSFAVIAATSISEAIATLQSTNADIILSSIALRSESAGFDLFRQVRSAPLTRMIPFLFLTSVLDRTTQLVGKRLGVDDFFTRPIDYELLIAALDGKIREERHR